MKAVYEYFISEVDSSIGTKEQFEVEHQKSFIELAGHLVDAGVILKEVLWNGKPQKQRDVATNNE